MSDINEQAANIASALSAFNNNKAFHSFISKSLNYLRQNNKETSTEVSVVSNNVSVVSNNISIVTNNVSIVTNNVSVGTKEKEAVESLLELVQSQKMHKKRKKNTNSNKNSNQEINIDDKDMEPIIKQLKIPETARNINKNSSNCLKILQCLINKCQKNGLVTCITSGSENNMCILGWSQMIIKEPLQFNIKIREMIEEDYNGI